MIHLLLILATGVVTSFFFWPFFFTFLPMVNTKMMMAACGLVTLGMKLSSGQQGKMNKDFFNLTLFSLGVSLASLAAMAYNNTPDDSYLDYFISMWVWLGAAYFMVNMIQFTHGKADVEKICYYLIGVAVFQCVLAELIEHNQAVKNFIDSILAGEGFMGKNRGRLYGLGCALDVAGSRFAVILIIIACLLPRELNKPHFKIRIFLLLTAFGIITIVGNIIGRTTLVGMIIALFYMAYSSLFLKSSNQRNKSVLTYSIIASIVLFFGVGTYLYNSDAKWRKSIRFGFEGFFSLVEKGKWEVHSNEMLKNGYIFPDNAKTWIIGDGYMAPTTNDPYYVGKEYKVFYMGTDVGYSRFIFYFGLIGMISFSLFMCYATTVCVKRHREYDILFYFILLVNFAVWLKVSTDIFLCFAPFLALTTPNEDKDSGKQHLSLQ